MTLDVLGGEGRPEEDTDQPTMRWPEPPSLDSWFFTGPGKRKGWCPYLLLILFFLFVCLFYIFISCILFCCQFIFECLNVYLHILVPKVLTQALCDGVWPFVHLNHFLQFIFSRETCAETKLL